MKKEQIKELVPEISEEQADALIELYEKCAAELKESGATEEELSEAYAKGVQDAEKKFNEAEFARILETELQKAGAKNTKAVRALLDTEELALENGVISGLEKQLEKLKAECDYLFAGSGKKPKFTSGNSAYGSEIDISKLSYRERLKLYRESPELYGRLTK